MRRSLVEDYDSLKASVAKSTESGQESRAIAVAVIIAALWAAAVVVRPSNHLLAGILATLANVTLVWWIHDAGHDAYFGSRSTSKKWIEFLGILFLGMPQIEYHYEVHRRHHGATNVIGRDGALNTGPIIWHSKMASAARKGLGRFQGVVWIFFVLPLTWLLITSRCISTMIDRNAYFRLSLIALRWAFFAWFFKVDLVFLLMPVLGTGFVLGFASSLNHFHMAMDDRPLAPFPESVFLTTQNLTNHAAWMTWWMGGLNLHIEHHLFPNLPHRELKRISPQVQAFAKKHNLPYQTCGFFEAVSKLWNRLQAPPGVEKVESNEETGFEALERALFLSVRWSAVFMPVFIGAGLLLGGVFAFTGVAIVFGYYFVVEGILVVTGLGVDSRKTDEFKHVSPDRAGWIDEQGIQLYGIMQILMVPAASVWLTLPGRSGIEFFGGLFSVAVMAGSIGGLVGHELIHRRDPLERLLGMAVYGSVNYAHFSVSHLHGHHRRIGLADDWSTSRKNETSYRFLWRALVHGYRGAWAIDKSNLMIKITIAQAMLSLSIFALAGPRGLAVFWALSLISACLMEMVNYLSHYGLVRERVSDGKLEPVANKHSWESANKVTNWFIFNAGKHSHHHRQPSAPHHQLTLANDKEYLPFGLPLMTIIAFVPPAFFRLMNPRLESALVEARPIASPTRKSLASRKMKARRSANSRS